jgi:iron complex outermembrane receptor protein
MRTWGLAGVLLLAGVAVSLSEQDTPSGINTNDLAINITGMSLEDLLKIEVTSQAKRPERLISTPAAITVLTPADIANSGAVYLPDVFRFVPGMQVAKFDASKWAIGVRGFNGRVSQKLLVMIDGRTVYDPLFSGVFWEAQDLVLEDIERIEVNRGPGGAIWGANAINGVINIITKHAKDTQGGLMSLGAGSEQTYFQSTRYGWQPVEKLYLRVYTKSHETQEGYRKGGSHDDWRSGHVGFRMDWEPRAEDSFMVQGDLYDTVTGNNVPPAAPGFPAITDKPYQDVRLSGGNVLGRWTHRFSDVNDMQLQAYFEHFEYDDLSLSKRRNTGDIDFQDHFNAGGRHDVVWGLQFRQTSDEIENGPVLGLHPSERTDQLYSAFGQYELTVIPDLLRVTAGAKVENNDYSGTEWQPSIRASLTPDDTHTIWASVSRAVRIPSRLESDLIVTNVASITNTVVGTTGADAEELVAYEAGLRMLLTPEWVAGLAFFYNDYDKLLTVENDSFFENQGSGHTYGAELGTRYQLFHWWQLAATYTYLHMNLEADPGSTGGARLDITEDSDPEHQATLRSSMALGPSVDLHGALRYVGKLAALDVPEYLVADLRLAWRPADDLEFSIAGSHLLDNHHPEQAGAAVSEVENAVYGKATWTF